VNLIPESVRYERLDSAAKGQKFLFRFKVVDERGKAHDRQKTLWFINTVSADEWVALLKRHGKWVSPHDKRLADLRAAVTKGQVAVVASSLTEVVEVLGVEPVAPPPVCTHEPPAKDDQTGFLP
jgi:hypothetical protein